MTLDISKLNNIKIIPFSKSKKETPCAEEKQISFSGLFRGTPDYNVKVPMQYSKIGVTTLDNGMELHEYKLANGQKVVVMPSDSPVLHLETYVKTGSMNEKDNERGISHFVEHMMFNGTRGDNGYKKINPGETWSLVDEIGASTNASTNYNGTSYLIMMPSGNMTNFEKAVEIQSAMVCNPAFTDEMIEKEKGPVCSEINLYSDVPESEIVETSIKNLLNVQTTSTQMIAGTVENINNLKRENLLDYYNTNYNPSNMTTVVTGNINPDDAMQIISKHFRSNNSPAAEQKHEQFNPITKTIRKDIFSPKANATEGVLSFVGPDPNDIKEIAACDAAAAILAGTGNSRLSTPLKHLNTELNIGSEDLSNSNNRNLIKYITYTTTEENSEKALKFIFDKLGNFVPPTQKELDNVKLLLKKNYEDIFESSTDANHLIASAALYNNLSHLSDYKKAVDSLTAEDLTNAVKKYFDTSKTSVAIIHPSNVTTEQLNSNYQQAQSLSFRGHIPERSTQNVSFKGTVQANSNIAANTNFDNKHLLDSSKVSEFILQNNTDIALYDGTRDKGSIKYKITCDAPANVKPGVVDILNEMFSRGSAYRTTEQFGEATSDICADITAGCNHSTLVATASFMPEKAGEAIDLMKENVLAPRFTYEDFEAAKQKVRELCTSADDSSFDYLRREIFPNQHYGETHHEILANLDSITLNDVMGLYQYYMQNGKATAAVTAPFSKNPDLKNTVFNRMSSCPVMKQNSYSAFESYIPVEKAKVFQKETNKAQADISMGYKFKLSDDMKDKTTLKLMTQMLSSSKEIGLFHTLREKEKLAYNVRAMNMNYDNNGILQCSIFTTTVDDLTKQPTYENVQRSIDGFQRQINLLKAGQFSDKDFEEIKLCLKSDLMMLSETTDAKTSILSDGITSKYGVNGPNMMYEMVDSITKQDVINMANYVFAGKPTYAVLANKETLDANSEYLKNLEK